MDGRTEISEHQLLVLKTYTRMMRAAGSVTMKMHEHLAGPKLTLSQFGVLEALYHLGPLCQRDIGKKILKSSGNMTLVIDNLEKRDLVVREKDPKDRRFMTVSLTEEGRALIGGLFPRHAGVAEKVFSVLSPAELTQLGELLEKIGKA